MVPGVWYQEREATLKIIREKMMQRGITNMTSIVDASDLKDETASYRSADTAAEKLKMAATMAAGGVAAVGVGVTAAFVENTVE